VICPPAYQQVLKGLPAVDYSARDIIYRPRNVRAHRVYGFSPVQQVLMTVNIALRRQLRQLDYFTEGSIPDALIGVPQSRTPDQIRQFQDYWDTEFSGDLAKRRRAKFVPGESAAKVVQTKEPQHKDDFDEWLARGLRSPILLAARIGVPARAWPGRRSRAAERRFACINPAHRDRK
jgi:phage portal protein BeeE